MDFSEAIHFSAVLSETFIYPWNNPQYNEYTKILYICKDSLLNVTLKYTFSIFNLIKKPSLFNISLSLLHHIKIKT